MSGLVAIHALLAGLLRVAKSGVLQFGLCIVLHCLRTLAAAAVPRFWLCRPVAAMMSEVTFLASPQPLQAALDNTKFSQLEALLNRSQMYTQFLTEQVRCF